MGLIKKVTTWSQDTQLDYLSVNPTRDEVTHFKVDPFDEADESITKLNTLKDFTNITCLDYSESQPGIVGVGEKDGFVKIVDVLGGRTQLVVRPKQRRCINAVSINNVGLVAMGLDKHRQDASLQVWDINYQKQGEDFVNLSFEYCVNESLVSLQFLNDISLLVASTKFIKEVDLRVKTPVYQHPTRLSYDIKLNPFNDWQFSSYGDDGTLAIWDRRKLSGKVNAGDLNLAQPLLTFDKLVGAGAASRKYMNSCFRWSSVQNREFATLHRGDTIKRWRLGSSVESAENGDQLENLFVSTVHDIATTFDRVATFDYIPKGDHKTSVICMRQSGTVYRIPMLQSYSKTAFNLSNCLLLSNYESSVIDEIKVAETEKIANLHNVNTALKTLSFEDLGIGEEYVPSIKSLPSNDGSSDHLYENGGEYDDDLEHSSVANSSDRGSRNLTEDEDYQIYWKPKRLLQKDISVIMRLRAMLGYGLDPMATVELIDQSKALQNNTYIRNTWRWLAIAKASVEDGTMVSGDLDLGYEGIIGIWNGLAGLSNQNRCSHDIMLTDKQLNKEMEKIHQDQEEKRKPGMSHRSSVYDFPDSPKNVQRNLCLIISGWDLSSTDYEEKYNIIIKKWALRKGSSLGCLFGDIPKAVEILGSAKKERLRLIATAIAGYVAYKDRPENNSWRNQCRKMASELDDPYLRVIFAFIADNDWWDILYEPAISLRERLGVALRFLNDADLTRFLDRTSSTVIANGELEGLILTGITPSGIDLLQSYVNKTSDVQSAALISLFGSPRYFKDDRVDEWVFAYRKMLNSWGLFSKRAKFDVLRTKLSTTSSGEVTTTVKPRQLYIQCVNCKKNINKPISTRMNLAGNALNGPAMKKIDNLTDSGQAQEVEPHRYSCPHCGTSFPRCAICLMPLGTSSLPFAINGIRSVDYKDVPESADLGNGSREEPTDTTYREDGDQRTDIISRSSQLTFYKKNLRRKQFRLNEWFSFCLSCNHGMHAGHAEEWFAKHSVCPTQGCDCQCTKY
ncbi:Sea4p KNAG_0C04320 [Huiozyma naganishii CBS 8797]|uniref:WD repeat protein mio zinc-ribbon like domain-containing protein n=1 Tax=Huiozyma naganishii (strain ATCC MYA-139 / BCRC 22969 / CBS 8797 / KCTC 17520 / NBRC 10181 / NCYC 3082 / Yp74L-3) TaxID=1071383 RepID=J7S4Y2_HUIN7|nr:hypothetical protein KNAG_0C04320 [Kazachstania naganishii CBS 8797]CCK69534.1 hypothetical protein KNAG_0C04320 [Kazachstania naganishii CBS 8797]